MCACVCVCVFVCVYVCVCVPVCVCLSKHPPRFDQTGMDFTKGTPSGARKAKMKLSYSNTVVDSQKSPEQSKKRKEKKKKKKERNT